MKLLYSVYCGIKHFSIPCGKLNVSPMESEVTTVEYTHRNTSKESVHAKTMQTAINSAQNGSHDNAIFHVALKPAYICCDRIEIEPRHEKTGFCRCVTAKLISAFVFATLIGQSLFYLYPKFQASSLLL